VADYAASLKTEIIRANADYDRYFNSKLEWQARNRREMHMHPPTATTELPTVDQWKRMSDTNVRLAAFSRRREQNAEIDRLPRFVAFETTHMSESEWLEIRSKFTRANFDVWWFGTDAVAFRQGY
jgi:hypothetical protein